MTDPLMNNPIVQRIRREGATAELLNSAFKDPEITAAFKRETGVADNLSGPEDSRLNDPNVLEQGNNSVICATCGVPLNRVSLYDDDQPEWTHGHRWKGREHDPIPKIVPLYTVTTIECDFCGVKGPQHWAYVGNSTALVTGISAPRGYGARWGACPGCIPYLDKGDFEGLFSRCQKISPQFKNLPAELLPEVRQYQMDFWAGWAQDGYTKIYTGPPIQPARLNPRLMPKLQQGLIRFWNQPGLYDKMCGHAIHNGQSLPAFTIGDEHADKFTYRAGTGKPLPHDAFARFQQHVTTGIQATTSTSGSMYWISNSFTHIASLAAADFTELLITRDQLPASFGFVVYEQPIATMKRPHGDAGIRAFTWTLVPGGIWLNIYYQGDDADPTTDVETLRTEQGWFQSPNPGLGIRFDHPLPIVDSEPELNFINTIFATWLLLTQPGVAEQRPAPIDKKAARAYQREHGKKLPGVILVDLRRRPRPADSTTRETGPRGPLKTRRYTRGHWKRQFFGPKRGQRKLIYISPYISGPDNAPLAVKPPTVKVLR